MRYLLDTCVVSEYKKLHPDKNVMKWLQLEPDENLSLSVLTIGEIEKGIV